MNPVPSPTEMWVVPHTHWDREWYEPHDVFRARLVAMMDELLDLLDQLPDYRFTLDGQSAAIQDYLELRPERTEQVRAAVARGQLAIGPFQILLDEFSSDGETTIRNLELGLALADSLGGAMRVGYLPDMFGHSAQTPQILRGFGLRDACMWRGVPESVHKHAFLWEALDGSAVRVEYQWDGYGNALKLFSPVEKLPELVRAYASENACWFDGQPILGMFGTDHMAPRADLAQILRDYTGGQPGIALTQLTLDEAVARRDHSAQALDSLPKVRGELRSHARGNLLPGVLSVRTNIKRSLARAERWLTSAERLDALVGHQPLKTLFDRAWNLVVQSTAHDSALGCGADATADQVENRIHVAEHSARGATDILAKRLSDSAPRGDLAVFNPSGWRQCVIVEHTVECDPDELPPAAQLLEDLPRVIGDEVFETEDLPRIIHRIHGQELFGKHIRQWSWEGQELEFIVADFTDDDFELADFVETMRRKMRERPLGRWRVRTVVPATSRVLLGVEVPGMGVADVGLASVTLPGDPVRRVGDALTNGLVKVWVSREQGLCVEDLVHGRTLTHGLALVDDGDCGDSYNFGPVSSEPLTEAETTSTELLESGPWRGRISWLRRMELPVGLDENDRSMRSRATCAQEIETLVELRVGEPFVRIRVSLTNAVADHRLRVLVPVGGAGVPGSWAAGQYGVTDRSRVAEGGWGEFPIPTFPATRFVGAGKTNVLLDKLVEYEVIDGQPDQLALTVVRAVGKMSVNVHPYRDEPAGSEIPVPGAQYLGKHVAFDFAIDLGAADWDASSIIEHADRFRFEPLVVPGNGRCATVGDEEPLFVDGRVALESLRRVDGTLEARFVNYHRHPEPLRFHGRGDWRVADLTGAVSGDPIDPTQFVVAPGRILSLRRVR